jgi:8-oxo-dGTP diphosphatase
MMKGESGEKGEQEPGRLPGLSVRGEEASRNVPNSEVDGGCWVCGGPVVERHCKIICRVCGFTRDCSDP